LKRRGKLVLENGEIFVGQLLSSRDLDWSGEVVFTTGMSGYVESLTDPSFADQLLVFTYPLIGNYGVPDSSDWESSKIQVRAAVISADRQYFSHFQAKKGIFDWFEEQGIPLLVGVDTRRLTKILRQKEGTKGKILPDDLSVLTSDGGICKGDLAMRFPLEKHSVLTLPPAPFDQGGVIAQSPWGIHALPCKGVKSQRNEEPSALESRPDSPKSQPKVIVLDGGLKQSILRELSRLPIHLKVVSLDHDFNQESYDGLVISNGPGDPSDYLGAIQRVKIALERKRPIFGICLGAQLLALAIGAKVRRLPLGHRGQNHPCLELSTGKAYVTSQNHGYAIDEETLPCGWRVSFRHLQDQTVSGIEHEHEPYFAVQFHPEGAPGPHDTKGLFKKFYDSLS
jgi:carbamoyl-phosphate synthase small subunit